MKQFNLTEYLKNPSQKVVTRDGRAVRIICTDYKCGNYPIIALIRKNENEEIFLTYKKSGTFTNQPNLDLFFASSNTNRKGWANLYKNEDVVFLSEKIYKSEEDAKEVARKKTDYITTIKIEWEE